MRSSRSPCRIPAAASRLPCRTESIGNPTASDARVSPLPSASGPVADASGAFGDRATVNVRDPRFTSSSRGPGEGSSRGVRSSLDWTGCLVQLQDDVSRPKSRAVGGIVAPCLGDQDTRVGAQVIGLSRCERTRLQPEAMPEASARFRCRVKQPEDAPRRNRDGPTVTLRG